MNNQISKSKGRPPKKEIVLPVFKNDAEIRKYLFNTAFELMLNLKESSVKSNNIKNNNTKIVRAKNEQYKLCLSSIKLLNNILKDKQIDDLAVKIDLLNESKVLDLPNSKDENNSLSDDKIFLEKLNLLEGLKNGF